MKNIKNLDPMEAVIFKDKKGNQLILIKNETEVLIITDGTEHEKEYSGLITFINSDGIELENSNRVIFWEYIEEINII
jgi:hypothetical protein